MAQVITDQDLNNPNKNQNQNQNPVTTDQTAQNQQQQYNPNQQRGSGYTNIQRIVQANQANKLGQTIGGNIQNAANQTNQNIGQAQQNFQQQSGQNRADTSQNAQLVQGALTNPTQIINDPNQVNKFQTLIGGNYQGPMGLQNAGQIQSQAQDVNQLGQAIGSAGGRTGLLQRFVGAPQYNAGQQTLDSLLLGATGGKDLANARRATAGIQNQAQQATQGAQNQAQEYAQRAQQFGQDVQNQFGKTVAGANNQLTQQAQQAQQQRDAQIAALQAQLGQGKLNTDIASQLGIQQGQMTYNVDPSKFLTENAMKANAQNVAGTQDYARMQALQQLGGTYAPAQAQQTLGQFQNPSQAGTFAASKAYNVNAPEFQQAYKTSQDLYNNTLNPVQSALADAQAHYNSVMASPGGGLAGMFAQMAATKQLQQAQANLNNTQQSLNQQYGTNTFNVQPGDSGNG